MRRRNSSSFSSQPSSAENQAEGRAYRRIPAGQLQHPGPVVGGGAAAEQALHARGLGRAQRGVQLGVGTEVLQMVVGIKISLRHS